MGLFSWIGVGSLVCWGDSYIRFGWFLGMKESSWLLNILMVVLVLVVFIS